MCAVTAPVARTHTGRQLCAPPTVGVDTRCARADLITTVVESAYYGRCTSSSATGGIVIIKGARVVILATYTEPTTGAEAIPHVHAFADELEALTSPI